MSSFAAAARSLLFAALAAVAVSAAHAQGTGVDAEADRLLRRMTDYLAGLQAFGVDTRNTLDAVLASGQKIEFVMRATATVVRPNKLRADRKSDLVDQSFFYDGRTLTLYNPAEKVYAAAAVPDTLEGMLDFARDRLDVVAPAGDFLYRDVYDRFMQVTTSGFVVGKAMIGGVSCDHLAFRGPEVDWQVWIADGDQPLPLRYVVTTRDVASYPEFSAVIHWNLSPDLKDVRFSFTPPDGAKEIDFLKTGSDAPASR
jgi:hypothetical protein